MPILFMHPLLRMIANHANFLAFNFRLNNFRFHFHALHSWRANGRFITVDYEQSISLELFCSFREEVHPQGLTFGRNILLATY